MNEPKPSKSLGLFVAAVMFIYAAYSIYSIIRVAALYKKRVEGTVKKIEGSFVPGNHVYVSQFNNKATYEFSDEKGKTYEASINSLMLSFKRAGSKIEIYYDEKAPASENIPVYSFYGDIICAATLIVIGSLLTRYMLLLP